MNNSKSSVVWDSKECADSEGRALGGGISKGPFAIPRIAEPEELTRLVLFVASDEASFSTGSEFIADGGALLGPVPDAN